MKKYLLSLTLSLLFIPIVLWGQNTSAKSLSSRLDTLIKYQLPAGSNVGISVYDLTTGKSLYTYQSDKLSRPASTMKLLTAVTALSRSDADNPFCTEVWYDGVIEHDTLQGNLYVVGGFDPEFDSLMMDSLIEEVITFPFSVISGQVYGDVYEKLLFNTKVKTAVLKNDVLTVTFAASLEPTFFASEITYMSSEGKNKTVLLKAPATQVKIDDFAGDHQE